MQYLRHPEGISLNDVGATPASFRIRAGSTAESTAAARLLRDCRSNNRERTPSARPAAERPTAASQPLAGVGMPRLYWRAWGQPDAISGVLSMQGGSAEANQLMGKSFPKLAMSSTLRTASLTPERTTLLLVLRALSRSISSMPSAELSR